ncbi:MAG TPA: neuromedin U [Verrucomicrobiae bacterium]|jgi:hypothetical protein
MNDNFKNSIKEPDCAPILTSLRLLLSAFLAVASSVFTARAEDNPSQSSSAELAKQTQNPVADVISVPIENYFYFNAGPNHATLYDLNIKPVIPFHLNEDWNLITRTIIPIINEPSLSLGSRSGFGLGDINPSFFLSPAKSSGFIWGVGPTFTLPTATDSLLGSGKFSMGPTAVALMDKGPWLFGALVYNQWSVTGWGKQNVNNMLIEPFANYNFGKGWHLSTAPLITANWEAEGSQQWTVPVGGGIGKLVRFGKLPADILVQAYSNVERPKYAPDWELRFQIQFLLPGFKKSPR